MQRLLKEGIACAATYVRVAARSPERGARLKTSLRLSDDKLTPTGRRMEAGF